MQTLQCLQAIVGQRHAVTFAFEQTLGDAAHGDGVIHHQHQRQLVGRLDQLGGHIRRIGGLASPVARGAQHTGQITVHRRQRHRVVDQNHCTRGQHRHTRQTRQTCKLRPEVFHHHFAVAQHFVHVQGQTLTRAAEHHHGQGLAQGFVAACRHLQQGTRPEEG